MSETARLQDQLRRALDGDAWHGPALRELLADVTAAVAGHRPTPGAHTIWELVLHITIWHTVVARRLAGELVRHPGAAENWAEVGDASDEAWSRALTAFWASAEALQAAVARIADRDLEKRLPGVEHDWTVYETVHGLIQHDLYHAGQIAVLKKARRGGGRDR